MVARHSWSLLKKKSKRASEFVWRKTIESEDDKDPQASCRVIFWQNNTEQGTTEAKWECCHVLQVFCDKPKNWWTQFLLCLYQINDNPSSNCRCQTACTLGANYELSSLHHNSVSTSDGGVERLRRRHHAPCYKTLCRQIDFEAVTIR